MSDNYPCRGRVVARYGASANIMSERNKLLKTKIRQKLKHIACGDYVTIEYTAAKDYVITEIHERKNVLNRIDPYHKIKSIAANIDQMMIVIAVRPKPDWHLIDQYLMTAESLDMDVVIVLNKKDLLADADTTFLNNWQDLQDIGYATITLSAKSSEGIHELTQTMKEKTNVLVGQSGVGKSSIVNAILPDAMIKTGDLSTQSEQGKHTTSLASLYSLGTNSGYLIDSPGVRSFTFPDLNQDIVKSGFKEIYLHAQQCKFNNCTHRKEPSCEVKQAVERQQISARRYQSYLRLFASCEQ